MGAAAVRRLLNGLPPWRRPAGLWCAAVALAGPPSLVLFGHAAVLLLAAFGHHPLWSRGDYNLAEAVALRDVGQVVRLVEAGADPNRAQLVRAGIVKGDAIELTPLEAAVSEDRVEILEFLLQHTGPLDDAVHARLTCFALKQKRWAVAGLLARVGGRRIGELRCEEVETPW